MLLKQILATCALALGALSAPSTPSKGAMNILPRDNGDDPNMGPRLPIYGFTSGQKEQIRQGHSDAVKLCYTMINAGRTEEFERVFIKYFNPADRDLVKFVLNNIVGDRVDLGNRMLNQIGIEEGSNEMPCWNDTTYAFLGDAEKNNPNLYICPRALRHSTFDGQYIDNIDHPTCDSIGDRVTWKMITLGHILVHEYLFFQALEGPTLGPVGGKMVALANGPVAVRNIDKNQARVNADSYAWFATELAWTLHCGRNFDAPIPGDDQDNYWG